MPADHRETAYAIPSVGPAVFSLELVLKVKVTAMCCCAFDELVMTLPRATASRSRGSRSRHKRTLLSFQRPGRCERRKKSPDSRQRPQTFGTIARTEWI